MRERGAKTAPFPSSRRLVTAAVRAGRRIVPMHGLLEVDVTVARRLLAEADPPLSFTAFIVASLDRTAAAHPAMHAYRDWRGRLAQVLAPGRPASQIGQPAQMFRGSASCSCRRAGRTSVFIPRQDLGRRHTYFSVTRTPA
jgi:hypothetical protein